MIRIIKKIEPYFSFIENINHMDAFCDTIRKNLNEYVSSCLKDDNITFIVTNNGIVTGIFSFLIIQNEKYAESLWILSVDKSAYLEMFNYLYEHYSGYECYFVYNPKNEILNSILKKKNAEFSPVQKEMESVGRKLNSEPHKVIKLSNEYQNQYIILHNKDLYWTGDKIIENGEFITLISLEDEIVTGYVDISPDESENHIIDVFVSEKYRNKGYGQSLIAEAINYSNPKKLKLEVDEDNYVARQVYEKLGFQYLNNKDIITVFLKLNR